MELEKYSFVKGLLDTGKHGGSKLPFNLFDFDVRTTLNKAIIECPEKHSTKILYGLVKKYITFISNTCDRFYKNPTGLNYYKVYNKNYKGYEPFLIIEEFEVETKKFLYAKVYSITGVGEEPFDGIHVSDYFLTKEFSEISFTSITELENDYWFFFIVAYNFQPFEFNKGFLAFHNERLFNYQINDFKIKLEHHFSFFIQKNHIEEGNRRYILKGLNHLKESIELHSKIQEHTFKKEDIIVIFGNKNKNVQNLKVKNIAQSSSIEINESENGIMHSSDIDVEKSKTDNSLVEEKIENSFIIGETYAGILGYFLKEKIGGEYNKAQQVKFITKALDIKVKGTSGISSSEIYKKVQSLNSDDLKNIYILRDTLRTLKCKKAIEKILKRSFTEDEFRKVEIKIINKIKELEPNGKQN